MNYFVVITLIFYLIYYHIKIINYSIKNIHFWKKNIKKFIRNPNLKNFKNNKKLENKYRLNFFIEENANLKNYTKKLQNNKD